MLYLLSHRVAEVTFGSKIGALWDNSGESPLGPDTAELMVINGKMMNTADVLSGGELSVTTSGFPKNIGGEWWAPATTAVDNVHEIHKAKLVAHLGFGGQRNAIEKFG